MSTSIDTNNNNITKDLNTTTSNPVHLSNIFQNIKTKQTIRIDLYKDVIKFYNLKSKKLENESFSSTPDLLLSLNDVAGSKIAKGHKKDDSKSYLTIYAYIISSKPTNNKRKRITFELAFSKFTTYNENLVHVNNWHLELDKLLKTSAYRLKENISNNLGLTNTTKPFCILVNPKAGAGKAKNIYHERVLPVLSEANIPCKLVLTLNQKFAKDFVKQLNLDDYRGILVISGDGLMFEVINGLMEREDWATAIKFPIGHIPGGSANALSCCVARLTNEAYSNLSIEEFASQTSFNITKSLSIPMDLVVYELYNKKIVHSFLAFEWAIVADVDYESEKYRFLGGLRFAIGAINRILNLRVYRGRISFLPADESKNYTPKNSSIKVNRNNEEIKVDQIETNLEQNAQETNEQNKKIKFKYLNPIDKPVPNDWLTIEDNFVFFLVSYLPLISPDFVTSNDSTFNDGNMHLTFIKEGITKMQLLQLFTDTESGKHLENPFVEYVKVKAFRLEPLGLVSGQVNRDNQEDGIMMVDGERMSYGVIQAEIFPSLGNILANIKDC